MNKPIRLSMFCLIIAMIILLASVFSGCSDKISNGVSVYTPLKARKLNSGVVASSNDYQMLWDSNSGTVLLVNKENQRIWASTPYDFYLQQKSSGFDVYEMGSPISIKYYEVTNRQEHTERAYEGVIEKGKFSAVRIKNGIRVEYDFSELSIRIPIEYVLKDNGLAARIVVSDIAEGDEYKLLSVDLLPYMASVLQGDSSYVFVPSGSGAIMYSDVRTDFRTYTEPVYGIDEVEQPATKTTYTNSVRLPVFGTTAGDYGILGVISEGEELASVNALAGDERLGYSTAYASFELRCSDTVNIQNKESLSLEVKSYTDALVDIDKVEVYYEPIEDESVDYIDMAICYRNWLIKNYNLEEKTNVDSTVAIRLLGGATLQKTVMGIVVDELEVATTLKQANEIVKQIKKDTDAPMSVMLDGFGVDGINSKKVAGEFKIDSKFGKKNDLVSLKTWCNNNDSLLFMNFDILHFQKSGLGLSTSRDAARRANNVISKKIVYSPVSNKEDKKQNINYLVSREKLTVLTENLTKGIEKLDLDGVALITLGDTAYSDFKNASTYNKNGMSVDATKIFNAVKKEELLLSSGSNCYAAVNTDLIWDTPFTSSKYDDLDLDVPFYQIVFGGYVPMTSPSVNLSVNPNQTFLKSISLGVMPLFTFSKNYDKNLQETPFSDFSASIWSQYNDDIVQMIISANKVLSAVSGTYITEYTDNDGVTLTRFSNGVQIYANYTSSDVVTDSGTVSAGDYLLVKGD